ETGYLDAYDYESFRRVLVEPFRLGGSTGFVTANFDADRDITVEPVWLTGPADAVPVVAGPVLHRPELRGLWHWSVWLDAEPAAEPPTRAEAGAQALYLADARPRDRATVVIDNTDPDDPKRVWGDSC